MDEQINELEQAIRSALTNALPGSEIRFDPYPGFGKLHPIIIWDGFEDTSFLERQQHIWSLLRAALTEEQRLATGFLLLASHAEASGMQPVAA